MTKFKKTNQIDVYRPIPESKPKQNWWKSLFEWVFTIAFWAIAIALIVEWAGS